MLLRAVALASLVLAVASGAEAREVKTGTVAKVARHRAEDGTMILWATIQGEHATLLALDGWLRPATYALVGDEGYVGLVRVPAVEKNHSCRNYVHEAVRARISTGVTAGDRYAAVVAIGPVDLAPTRARVLRPDDPRELPPDGATDLYGAIDLDGDGRVDHARYVYQCDAMRRRMDDAPDTCVDLWARTEGGWKKTVAGGFPPCL